MKKTNQITTTNITNNTNTTTNKGVNNMKKTRKFKTRLIAGILSVITVFSVGTMAISSASVYPAPKTAAARGLNRTLAARRTAPPPLI